MNPEVTADWWTWAFWARDPESLRNLGLIFFGVVGLFLLAWRTWNVHRQAGAALDQSRAALDQSRAALQQADTAAQRHEAQVEADREQRITDSFTRAVEQLGDKENLTARLGAIYALERIARESARDHWPIMETLTAYVRERALWVPEKEEQAKRGAEGGLEVKPDTDVQAVLTVIGRRRREHDPKGRRLELRGIDLEYVDLENAHLEHALIAGAHLESANLAGAYLIRADLELTVLEGALLQDVHLEGASLFRAPLEGADLTGSDITREQLDEAITDENTKVPSGLKTKCAPLRPR